MIYEIANYRIKPYDNHLCWEIFEYREVTCNKGENKGKTSKKWVSTGKYPSTFGYALRIVYELMLKNGDEVVRGLPAAIKTAKKINDDLFKAIEPKGE